LFRRNLRCVWFHEINCWDTLILRGSPRKKSYFWKRSQRNANSKRSWIKIKTFRRNLMKYWSKFGKTVTHSSKSSFWEFWWVYRRDISIWCLWVISIKWGKYNNVTILIISFLMLSSRENQPSGGSSWHLIIWKARISFRKPRIFLGKTRFFFRKARVFFVKARIFFGKSRIFFRKLRIFFGKLRTFFVKSNRDSVILKKFWFIHKILGISLKYAWNRSNRKIAK